MKQKNNKTKSISGKCSIKWNKKSKNFPPSSINSPGKVPLMKINY